MSVSLKIPKQKREYMKERTTEKRNDIRKQAFPTWDEIPPPTRGNATLERRP